MEQDADELSSHSPTSVTAPSAPRLEFDAAKYASYLEDVELSDSEQEQLLRALFDIMMAFVDMGFGVHPVQETPSEKRAKNTSNTCISADSVLYSSQSKTTNDIQS